MKVKKIKFLKFFYKHKRFFYLFFNRYTITMMSEEEKSIFMLITKLINKEETKIMVRPITEVIHVISDNYYFVFGPGKVKFTNHNYLMDINISDKFFDKMKTIIFNKIENDREKIENEIFSSRLKILNKIGEEI